MKSFKEKCIICDKELIENGILLCESHTFQLYEIISNNQDTITNPSLREHCMICGEWDNRVIVNFPSWNYICNLCLKRAMKVYSHKA